MSNARAASDTPFNCGSRTLGGLDTVEPFLLYVAFGGSASRGERNSMRQTLSYEAVVRSAESS